MANPTMMEDYGLLVKALYDKEADCTERGLVEGFARAEWRDFHELTAGDPHGTVATKGAELLEMSEVLSFLSVRAVCNCEEAADPAEKYNFSRCRKLYSSLSNQAFDKAEELMGE